jgi:hypothetical protein
MSWDHDSPGAEAAITILKIIKNLAYTRYKKPEYKEGVGNTFNSGAIVLGAPRFNLPDHFDGAGNLYTRKIYLGQDPISKFSE